MGSCFSKKNDCSSSSSSAIATGSASVESLDPNKFSNNNTQKVKSEQKIEKKIAQEEEEAKKEKEEENTVMKEIFVIKHRKSHDRRSPPQQNVVDGALSSSTSTEETGNNISNGTDNVVVRTSSCTKEEVDAILIQCGRLSRSNSSGKTTSSSKKYSGSKRSFEFDHNDHENDQNVAAANNADYDSKRKGNYSHDDDEVAEKHQHRNRHRQSGRPSPQGRRRTPSREREQQKHRSGSRERGSGSGNARRVSRSPGRRSETTPNSTTSVTTTTANANANCSSNKPGKMVSVPATVSSMVMDKSNNCGNANNAAGVETTAIKRISVKRNVGEAPAPAPGSRSAASPRTQSPARTNAKGSNENQQQPSLSRSSSRKAEQSPYRRNPLSEIDPNSLAYPQSAGNKAPCTNNTRVQNRNKEIEVQGMPKESNNALNQKPNPDMSNNRVVSNKATREQQLIAEESKTQPSKNGNITVRTAVGSGDEGLEPLQTLTRSKPSRGSRDLDLNPEALLNPAPSYTTLLLEDIQNFHQKTAPSFSLPPCLTKACSILEAVADLNSTTSFNLSCAFSEDRRSAPTDLYNKSECNFSSGANLVGKKLSEAKDPYVESEVLVTDDLMEPSFHKYVTVRRGGTLDEDMEEQESSGSNSFVGSGQQQHWGFSSSSWEPNSADSTDRWTSRSNTREQDQSPLGFQRHALPEAGHDVNETKRGLGEKKNNYNHRVELAMLELVPVSGKGLHAIPIVSAAAST